MKHKTILITGASRGLGLALADHWSPNNSVISISRNPGVKLNANVYFYSCDLAEEPQVMATLKKINKDFPCIDILINNAAILMSVPLGIMKSRDISRMVDVNLKAPMLISKSVFRKMILARSGQIINILSMAPKLAALGDSVYAGTKGGLEAFSRVLNKEGHPYGVHVNNIGLSAYPSRMLEQIVGGNPEKVLSLIPHKQYAPLKEIIAAIEYFIVNNSDIGGQTIYFGGI